MCLGDMVHRFFFSDSFESFRSFLLKSTVFFIYQSKKRSREGSHTIFGAIKNDTQKLRFSLFPSKTRVQNNISTSSSFFFLYKKKNSIPNSRKSQWIVTTNFSHQCPHHHYLNCV